MELLRRMRLVSDFIASMPGLPIIIAVGLIILNFIFQLLPAWPVIGWIAHTDLWLHLGLVVGFLGMLLGEAF